MNEIDRRRRLESLFVAHAAAVRAYAARRVAAGEVDDIASEVFVVAWRRLDDVPGDPLPWLLGCARRIVANRRRGHRRQEALRDRLGRERPVSVQSAGSDRVLSEALATLSDSDREVLMLVAWEGLQPERAAVVLGCSRRAFAMRLHRARARLSAAMARLDPTWTDPMEAVR